ESRIVKFPGTVSRGTIAARTDDRLSLKDHLSHLTFDDVRKLLGSDAHKLLADGSKRDLSPTTGVYLRDDLFRLTIPGPGRRPEAIVTINLSPAAVNRLKWNCTACNNPCDHVGAAFSMILEEKTALGLAVAPRIENDISPKNDQELV